MDGDRLWQAHRLGLNVCHNSELRCILVHSTLLFQSLQVPYEVLAVLHPIMLHKYHALLPAIRILLLSVGIRVEMGAFP